MIRVGTASWTDPTLLACGRFYPHDVAAPAARLAFYASRFPLVEVNASYYAIPDPMQAHGWAQRTPSDFRFHVKAFRLFTGHPTPVVAFQQDIARALRRWTNQTTVYLRDVPAELVDETWRRFLASLEPLRMAGKLDAVHLQFPPWIRPGAATRGHVEDVVGRLADFTASVEWRHAAWFKGPQRERTLDWMRDLHVAHTIVDAPAGLDNAAPAVWETTHPELAVVRMHGRNAAAWNHRGSASSGRFMYDYTEEELAEIAARIKEISASIARTHVVLNTNYQDQGVQNAARLGRALDQD